MTELWVGAIASTIAACIWAAWGPKVLLGTILTPIVIVVVLIGAGMYEDNNRQKLAQKPAQSRVLTFDDVPFDPNKFLKGEPRK